MKRTYCLLLLLVCLSSVAFAQLRYGVTAGANLSNIRHTDTFNSILPGYHVGAHLDCAIGKDLYVQPSLLFTRRGCRNNTIDYESKIKLNYLQLPIIVSYRYPLCDVATFDVNIGPYLAMGINGESIFDGYDSNNKYVYEAMTEGLFTASSEQKYYNHGSLYNRFDAGFRFGLGTHYGEHLGLSLHYDLGVINFQNEESKESYFAKSKGKDIYSRNGSFQISFSFTY